MASADDDAGAVRDGFHHLPVGVYYEDTDCTGVVYHSNYLKYFERSREHLLGPESLVRLFNGSGRSFVVTTVEVHFKAGARHGDRLEVRTRPQATSAYRLVFDQQVWNTVTGKQVVAGTVQMVCVQRDLALCALPRETIDGLAMNYPPPPAAAKALAPTTRPSSAIAADDSASAVGDAKKQQQLLKLQRRQQLKQQKQQKQQELQRLLAKPPHVFELEVFYEDTDFTGVVYYANYLKFMERARSRLAGMRRVAASEDPKVASAAAGLRVYKAHLTYKAGARHGDLLAVHTRVVMESDYRAVFHQDVLRVEGSGGGTDPGTAGGPPLLLVSGQVELIFVDPATQLPGKFPPALLERLAAARDGGGGSGSGGGGGNAAGATGDATLRR